MNTTSSKLSLILMRDDGEARSIRISKKGLLLLITLTIMSPITGLIGLWVGWEAWNSISNWQQEKLAYQIQVDELRVQLERFATLEALLKRQDAALSNKNPNVPSVSGKDKGDKKSQPPVEAIKESVKKKEEQVKEVNNTSIQTPNVAPTEKTVLQSSAIDISRQSTMTSTSNTIDHGVVKIENVQAKVLDDKRIQVQLGLFSTEKVPQISGYVQLALIASDGKKYELLGSETSFRISRFKSIVINAPLSVSKATLDTCQLLVEVVTGDKVIYRQKYPFIDQ